ncbi:MAG: adenylate/guanylate cyclase domain-containing protein [Pseudomonadota bacterium]
MEMSEPDLVRRLTTIMDIDVVGFSTLSGRDEEHALALLGSRMATAQTVIRAHRGRVFKLTGDGLLAEFASPVEAVRAALEIQEAMRSANGSAGPEDQMVLRIGVNLGDVVESGDDLMGDAVNVAARLESIAPPGGICVSAAVHDQIEGKLMLRAQDMGEQRVKNIPRTIHAYRLALDDAQPPPPPARPAPAAASRRRRVAVLVAVIGALVAALAAGGFWLLHERPTAAPLEARRTGEQRPPAQRPEGQPPAAPEKAPATAPPASSPGPAAASTATAATPAPGASAVPRHYVAADVPFVAAWRRGALEHYGLADGAKALAINVRGFLASATRRVDTEIARRAALDECNGIVEREVPIVRDFDRCMIYAVGNEVVWSYRQPPTPPPPYVPTPPSPPILLDPATVPLISAQARRNLEERYLKSDRSRAYVMGRRHFEWWSIGDSDEDAIRRNLQTCGQITGFPCVVYAVRERVMVQVPKQHRVMDVFAPEDLANLDPDHKAAVERYLIADDWRAIALAANGRAGIVSGSGSEGAATGAALAACARAGGTDCTVVAVGPFLVAPR